MSKLENNRPFGAILSSKIKIGDLVSWSEWKVVDNLIDEDIYYGTVIEKVTKINGGRHVIIVLVACSDTGDIISLNPFQLRLKETN